VSNAPPIGSPERRPGSDRLEQELLVVVHREEQHAHLGPAVRDLARDAITIRMRNGPRRRIRVVDVGASISACPDPQSTAA
jgi:hypothetical protein